MRRHIRHAITESALAGCAAAEQQVKHKLDEHRQKTAEQQAEKAAKIHRVSPTRVSVQKRKLKGIKADALFVGLVGPRLTLTIRRTKAHENTRRGGYFQQNAAITYSRLATTIGRAGLTSVFGMVTGVSPHVSSPRRI